MISWKLSLTFYIGKLDCTGNLCAFMIFYPTEMSDLAKRLKTGEPTLQLIIDGLLQPLGHDIREGKSETWRIVSKVGHFILLTAG